MAAHLPDLFLLSAFKKLNTQDRLNSSLVCPNWFHRVREVNKSVQHLTIAVHEVHPDASICEQTYMRVEQLTKSEKKEDQEWKFEPFTEWSTLHFSGTKFSTNEGRQLTLSTVQQIMAVFPSITKLNFVNSTASEAAKWECLIEMLGGETKDTSPWSDQLRTLQIVDLSGSVSPSTNELLFKAVNYRLPALKRLAFFLNNAQESGLRMKPLPVLARLSEVQMRAKRVSDNNVFTTSLQEDAQENAHLGVVLAWILS